MRKVYFALALLALTGQASARQGWAMSHDVYLQPFWMERQDGYAVTVGPAPTAAEKAKALEDRRLCAPVKVWTDRGTIIHPASDCLR